eukprot:5631800-Prymnesium_polylepis.1
MILAVAPSTRVAVLVYSSATAPASASLVNRLRLSCSANAAGARGGRLPSSALAADESMAIAHSQRPWLTDFPSSTTNALPGLTSSADERSKKVHPRSL